MAIPEATNSYHCLVLRNSRPPSVGVSRWYISAGSLLGQRICFFSPKRRSTLNVSNLYNFPSTSLRIFCVTERQSSLWTLFCRRFWRTPQLYMPPWEGREAVRRLFNGEGGGEHLSSPDLYSIQHKQAAHQTGGFGMEFSVFSLLVGWRKASK